MEVLHESIVNILVVPCTHMIHDVRNGWIDDQEHYRGYILHKNAFLSNMFVALWTKKPHCIRKTDFSGDYRTLKILWNTTMSNLFVWEIFHSRGYITFNRMVRVVESYFLPHLSFLILGRTTVQEF